MKIFKTVLAILGLLALTNKSLGQALPTAIPGLPNLPIVIPAPDADGIIYFTDPSGAKRPTTINPELQYEISEFIKKNGNQIAAVVVAEAKTGKILAMAQGQSPESWGSHTHSALYSGFPAASIFKNVSTAAAIEIAELDETQQIGLQGGCANVNKRGVWLKDIEPTSSRGITLSKAYGRSCNGFFAKLAVDYVGLGTIINFANKFGWGNGFATDFHVEPSPIFPPKVSGSSIDSVGRFAAGFGLVGLSAAHGAWFSIAMANDGNTKPLQIFADTNASTFTKYPNINTQLYSPKTGQILRDIMKKTTHGGTATSIFNRKRYRSFRDEVGGKTGTLTGTSPAGLTTWFTGMMPFKNPEVVVAAVVVATDRWYIKGSHLAAESLKLWNDQQIKKKMTLISQPEKCKRKSKKHRCIDDSDI